MQTPDRPPLLNPAPVPPRRRGALAALRASFLTGLVVIAPIGLTVWLIWAVTGWMDSWVLPLVPQQFRPEHYIGINLRGIGVAIFLIFTAIVGWAAKGYIGRSLIRLGEQLVDRTPIVRSVYGGIKQIAETILNQSDAKFDRACLIEYPRKGVWGLGFVSGAARGEIGRMMPGGAPMLAVFLPTTPNPTSGFLLYVPENEVHILDMTVEDAAKLIISAGLVYPAERAAPDKVPGSGGSAAQPGQPNSVGRSTESR